jgi:two-component system nitrate/nitrite response regulator NarP
MQTIAILHPCEVWSAGLVSLAESCGFRVVNLGPAPQRIQPLFGRTMDILILAGRLIRHAKRTGLTSAQQGTSIVVVVEPGELPDADQLAGFAFHALLSSNASSEAVRACLQSVGAGHAWLDPSLCRSTQARESRDADWSCLSARELEVARLAASGLSNKRIAKALRVSDGTVKVHMHHILAKLKIERRAELRLSPPTASAMS